VSLKYDCWTESRADGAMTTTDMTRVKLISREEVNQAVDRVLKARWCSRLRAALCRLQQRVFGRSMSSRPCSPCRSAIVQPSTN